MELQDKGIPSQLLKGFVQTSQAKQGHIYLTVESEYVEGVGTYEFPIIIDPTVDQFTKEETEVTLETTDSVGIYAPDDAEYSWYTALETLDTFDVGKTVL